MCHRTKLSKQIQEESWKRLTLLAFSPCSSGPLTPCSQSSQTTEERGGRSVPSPRPAAFWPGEIASKSKGTTP